MNSQYLLIAFENNAGYIKLIMLCRMIGAAAVIIACIGVCIELSNLQKLTECQPLSEPIVLGEHGLKEESVDQDKLFWFHI